jgi:3-oxoacyl-(acyl-carrier-protein) synthase
MKRSQRSDTPAACVSAIGSAQGTFDLRPLWRAQAGGPADWEDATQLSVQLAHSLAQVAGDALQAAGADGRTAAGCVLGTVYGFGHVAEGILKRLELKGPAWLDPEAFIHYPAHIVAALVCQRLGLTGEATTFLGPSAGLQALGHASRSIKLGKCTLCLAGAYEATTPAAAECLTALGMAADATSAKAAFVVLAPVDRHARAIKNVPISSEPQADARSRQIERQSEYPSALSAFFAIARLLACVAEEPDR